MKSRIRHLTLTGLMLLSVPTVFALEIPLSGGTDSKGGSKIGFVDMDRIFEIFPKTQAAKEDYAKQLKKKRELLAAKEAELKDIESRIGVLESTLKDMSNTSVPSSSSTIGEMDLTSKVTAGGSDTVANMKKDLEAKRGELQDLRAQASKDLNTFQEQQSQLILGKIYQALKELALEEQVSVVVDKTSVLYGDATIDLTDKLTERVRGF